MAESPYSGATAASANSAPLPPTSSGLKLKFKLGSSSAPLSSSSSAPVVSASSSQPVPPTYAPAPSSSSGGHYHVAPNADSHYRSPSIEASASSSRAAMPPPPAASSSRRLSTTAVAPPAAMAPPKRAEPVESETAAAREAEEETYRAVMEKESKGVSTAKYRALKRKYQQAAESRDNNALALHRTQKLLVRLREENSSLLDRVLLLSQAAGLTPEDLTSAQDTYEKSERAREFPLLYPPPVVDLSDRPREMPTITTATDLTTSAYNAPTGPPLPPVSLPPRERAKHYLASVAADKLREDVEARRAAQGLEPAMFPAVAVLGLEGSTVAHQIERILTGKATPEPEVPMASSSKAGGKRKRENTGGAAGGGGGRSASAAAAAAAAKAKAESNLVSLHALPNPFAGGAGASDAASFVGRGSAPPLVPIPSTSSETPSAPTATASGYEGTEAFDSPAGSTMSFDDQGDVKPTAPADSAGSRKHRKSDVPATERMIKPKKLKTHGITSGTYQIPFVLRHPDGSPVLPMPVGIMVLKNVGAIVQGEHFHTERYIFPVGYEAVRKYPSMIDDQAMVEYTCRIVDGGAQAPRFDIIPADQPGVVISAGTPTGAWSQIVKAANKVRARNHSNSVSGPDYYGLAQNVVKALIQELPGARDVPGYIWQNFVEDPDPATQPIDEPKIPRRAAGAPRKVTGAKRKIRPEEIGGPDDDGSGTMAVDGSYSMSPSPVSGMYAPSLSPPVGVSGYPAANEFPTPTSSLSSLLHGSATSNPYALPPAEPARSPVVSSAFGSFNNNDPYSLPPPSRAYQSPTVPAANQWTEAGSLNSYPSYGGYGGFDNRSVSSDE